MDRISIILEKKEENGPRASSAPALGLNTIIFKHVYWYMQQISGELLQDHWSSCLICSSACQPMILSIKLASGTLFMLVKFYKFSKLVTLLKCT